MCRQENFQKLIIVQTVINVQAGRFLRAINCAGWKVSKFISLAGWNEIAGWKISSFFKDPDGNIC